VEKGEQESKLKIAIPEGHLKNETRNLLWQAGFKIRDYEKDDRVFRPRIDGYEESIEATVLRPQEIPFYVANGAFHAGITGLDWWEEWPVKDEIKELLDLEYGHVTLAVAIPKEVQDKHSIGNLDDLLDKLEQGKWTIATEYMYTARRLIYENAQNNAEGKRRQIPRPAMVFPLMPQEHESPIQIVYSIGATEAKPLVGADVILDCSETGRTLRMNDLKVIHKGKQSTARLFANRESLKEKRVKEQLLALAAALHGALIAKHFFHLFANIPEYDQEKLEQSRLWDLAQRGVTIVGSGPQVRIDALIARKHYHEALLSLWQLKATDIVVFEPQGVIWPKRHHELWKNAPYLELLKDLERENGV
jgi:ATP phosphoribosyltransferase